MIRFQLYEGYLGSGKSLMLVKKAEEFCKICRLVNSRNEKLFSEGLLDEPLPLYKVASNIKFSDDFIKEYSDVLEFWERESELISLRNRFVIWDEIQIILDAHKMTDMSADIRSFLAYMRKNGIFIAGASQSYYHIVKRARQYITSSIKFRILFPSDTPSPLNPFPKPRGLVFGFERIVNPLSLSDTEEEKFNFFPSELFFVRKKDILKYDTKALKKPSSERLLQHIRVNCECGGEICGYKTRFVWASR